MSVTTRTDARLRGLTRVDIDGEYAGTVVQRGPRSFSGLRHRSEVGVDIRRVSTFRSFDAALAFVARQSSAAEVNADAALICAGPGPVNP